MGKAPTPRTRSRDAALLALTFLVGVSPSAIAGDPEGASNGSAPTLAVAIADQPAIGTTDSGKATPSQDHGSSEAAALPRWGVGVSAGPGVLLSLPALTLGLAARARLLDWLVIEPHVDGAAGYLFVVFGGLVQVGVPVVAEVMVDPVRLRFGAGPVLSYGRVIAEFSDPRDTFLMAGGEGLVGVAFPVNEHLELNAHAAGRLEASIDGGRVPYLPHAFATFGAMVTF